MTEHECPVRIDKASWHYMNGKSNRFAATEDGGEVKWLDTTDNNTPWYLGLNMPVHPRVYGASLCLVKGANLNPNDTSQTSDPPDPKGPNRLKYYMSWDDWDTKLKGGEVAHGPVDCIVRGKLVGNTAYYSLIAKVTDLPNDDWAGEVRLEILDWFDHQ